MILTIAEVEHIAKLARIELTKEEKEKFALQLTRILDYVTLLSEVDTENVIPTAHVTGLENVTREDKVANCPKKTRDKILAAFPDRDDDYLKVKSVF